MKIDFNEKDKLLNLEIDEEKREARVISRGKQKKRRK